jgi:muramoyltetrapeptide carboxypeptidase LdcA involved in peptidoglycan recycling
VNDATAPRPIRVPAAVRPGAHLRIVSPAMATLAHVPARQERAARALLDAGYTVSYGRHAFEIADDGVVAGTPAQRAADLTEAFQDPAVDAVLAADAGTGTREVLDHLDPRTFAAHPKPFIGYCDNVFLNQFLASEAGLASLYGCTLMVHFGEAGGAYPETFDFLARALDSSAPLVCTPPVTRTSGTFNWYDPVGDVLPRVRNLSGGWTALGAGAGEGTLLGGEITVVADLVEMFRLDLRGAVLFWDVAFHGESVPEHFRRLCERVDLTGIAAMVVGFNPSVPPVPWAETVRGLVDEYLPSREYPVLVNTDLSHTCPAWTVPFGEHVLVSTDRIEFPRRAGILGTTLRTRAGRC